MKTYKYAGHKLTLKATDKQDSTGHILVSYSFKLPDGTVLFEGQDFGASPMHSPEDRDSACNLIAFLTLKPGDVDDEYFENYTPTQIAWRDNLDENFGYYWRELLGDKDL